MIFGYGMVKMMTLTRFKMRTRSCMIKVEGGRNHNFYKIMDSEGTTISPMFSIEGYAK